MTSASRGGAVIRAQRLFRARRRAGRRRGVTVALVVAATIATVVGVGWGLAGSSLVALRYVTVEGTSRLTIGQVLGAAGVRAGTSLVWLDPAAVARRVDHLRPVAAVQVTRRWPHGLVIRVTERRPAGIVTSTSGSELLDRDGVAFAPAPGPEPALVQVQVAAAVPGPGEPAARAAMRVVAELPLAVRHRVESVHATTSLDVSVRLRDGRTIVWGAPTDAATKTAVLRTLLRRPAQVYDVSTPSVAVTR